MLSRTVIENPWIPKVLNGFDFPSVPQAIFLTAPQRELLYGGAAGGGKSVALLAAALQYATVPGYNALLLRRTFADLNKPDALIPMSHQWLQNTGAKWNEQRHQWTIPTGAAPATLSFGYLEHINDVYQYQGAQFQFIGFDELTQFAEPQYTYLFSRLRRPMGLDVPLRMRAASNPGGVGHVWVMERFNPTGISPRAGTRAFIPAKLNDNPGLDKEAYRQSFEEMDDVTRAQLEDGDWDAFTGQVFHEWRRSIHICKPFMLAPHWARWIGNDPGYADPSVWIWFAASETGEIYAYREMTFRQTEPTEQAKRVKEASNGEVIDFIVTGMDAFISQRETGKSLVDYYMAGGLTSFRRPDHGSGCRARRAQTVHHYLNPYPKMSGEGMTARLQVWETCDMLIKTLPTLPRDETDPEAAEDKPGTPDHWYDALGYGLQAHHTEKTKRPDYERALPGSAADVLRHRDILSPPKKAKDPFGV